MEEDKIVQSSTKKGRPSVTEQKKIKKKCEEAFNLRLTIRDACKYTGYAMDTISKYYGELRDNLIDKLDKDFLREQRVHREFAMEALREKVEKLKELQLIIGESMKESENEAPYLSLLLKTIEDISNYEQQLHALGMSPTLDIQIAAKVLGNAKPESRSSNTS
jgi:flagellar biosynthesis chaperone FliJ